MTKKRLKQLAKNYRKTKRYPNAAKLAEYEYLSKNWDKVEKLCRDNPKDLVLSDAVAITIGVWQIEHGFYLTSRQVGFKK